jgi:thymidine kinase
MIKLYVGPVGAGKTSKLIEHYREAKEADLNCVAIKHCLDTRYQGSWYINSHDGESVPCLPRQDIFDIYEVIISLSISRRRRIDLLVIDEVQFFSELLADALGEMSSRVGTIVLGGLQTDFKRQKFPTVSRLLQSADEVYMLEAECYSCKKAASYTQRFTNGAPSLANEEVIRIGDLTEYFASCKTCHVIG